MTKLDKNWLTEGLLDFEYKKYVLLAYLNGVKHDFSRQKLFPALTELQEHLAEGLAFRRQKQVIQHYFPKKAVRFDPEALQIRYEELYKDSGEFAALTHILDYALPLFSGTLKEGEDRYEEIRSELQLEPIGVIPLRNDEGYVFIVRGRNPETLIYRYRAALYARAGEREIKTWKIGAVRRGPGSTFENLKIGLIKKYHQLPNPAAYLVESKKEYPLCETLLPLTRQLMVRNIVFT